MFAVFVDDHIHLMVSLFNPVFSQFNLSRDSRLDNEKERTRGEQ